MTEQKSCEADDQRGISFGCHHARRINYQTRHRECNTTGVDSRRSLFAISNIAKCNNQEQTERIAALTYSQAAAKRASVKFQETNEQKSGYRLLTVKLITPRHTPHQSFLSHMPLCYQVLVTVIWTRLGATITLSMNTTIKCRIVHEHQDQLHQRRAKHGSEMAIVTTKGPIYGLHHHCLSSA